MGTYGREAMVKACSRPRTALVPAAKAEVGRKSLAARRAGSIPASGTIVWTLESEVDPIRIQASRAT